MCSKGEFRDKMFISLKSLLCQYYQFVKLQNLEGLYNFSFKTLPLDSVMTNMIEQKRKRYGNWCEVISHKLVCSFRRTKVSSYRLWTGRVHKLETYYFIKVCIDSLVARKVTSMVAFGFLSQILGSGGELWMLLCHSMHAGWLVGTLELYLLCSNLFELSALTSSRDANISRSHPSHLVKLFFFFWKFILDLIFILGHHPTETTKYFQLNLNSNNPKSIQTSHKRSLLA